jgi:hypothetical protein
LVGTTRLAPVDAAPSTLPGRAAAGGPTQLDDPQAARNRHEQDPGDRRQQQRHPDGEYALEGEEGDLYGIPFCRMNTNRSRRTSAERIRPAHRPPVRECWIAAVPEVGPAVLGAITGSAAAGPGRSPGLGTGSGAWSSRPLLLSSGGSPRRPPTASSVLSSPAVIKVRAQPTRCGPASACARRPPLHSPRVSAPQYACWMNPTQGALLAVPRPRATSSGC